MRYLFGAILEKGNAAFGQVIIHHRTSFLKKTSLSSRALAAQKLEGLKNYIKKLERSRATRVDNGSDMIAILQRSRREKKGNLAVQTALCCNNTFNKHTAECKRE